MFWNGSWQVSIILMGSNFEVFTSPLFYIVLFNSLTSVVFGATAVYPSAGFHAQAALAACQNEK